MGATLVIRHIIERHPDATGPALGRGLLGGRRVRANAGRLVDAPSYLF